MFYSCSSCPGELPHSYIPSESEENSQLVIHAQIDLETAKIIYRIFGTHLDIHASELVNDFVL